jgi:hypothetical protein
LSIILAPPALVNVVFRHGRHGDHDGQVRQSRYTRAGDTSSPFWPLFACFAADRQTRGAHSPPPVCGRPHVLRLRFNDLTM